MPGQVESSHQSLSLPASSLPPVCVGRDVGVLTQELGKARRHGQALPDAAGVMGATRLRFTASEMT